MRYTGMMCGVFVLTAAAQALTPLGPPTTNMRAGQWSVGGLYGWSEQDIVVTDLPPGLFPGQTEVTLRDMEFQMLLANIAVGLATDRAELFGRIGVVKADAYGMDSDEELAVGGGARITTNLDEPLSFGLIGQVLYFELSDAGLEDKILEGQLALGPCWRFSNGLLVYGGPMVHVITGRADFGPFGKADLEQDSWFGGYIGLGVDLPGAVQITGEVQATPDAWGVGVNAQVRF